MATLPEPHDGPDYDYDDWDYEDPDAVDDDGWDDCGLGPSGQCSMAGTEWCDWECGRLN